MVVLLFALGVILWAIGGMTFLTASTVYQEQVAAIVGASGSVLFAGGAIVGAIQELQTTVKAGIIAAVQEVKGAAPSSSSNGSEG